MNIHKYAYIYRAEEMKRAKNMKANLTKTSIIMGDDKEYY
jgi:hypothetical protein